MVAAYYFHLCANRPFLDGSKRVAFTTAELSLLVNGIELPASDDERGGLMLGIAGGKLSKEAVIEFYRNHLGSV